MPSNVTIVSLLLQYKRARRLFVLTRSPCSVAPASSVCHIIIALFISNAANPYGLLRERVVGMYDRSYTHRKHQLIIHQKTNTIFLKLPLQKKQP